MNLFFRNMIYSNQSNIKIIYYMTLYQLENEANVKLNP